MVTFIRGQTFEERSAPNMAHEIVFTRRGRKTYNNCVNYILERFKDPFAATNLNREIERALGFLESSPASCPLCDNPKLNKRGIRKIHLRKYKYKIFYHIVGKTVIIDALIHDSQDFENVLG